MLPMIPQGWVETYLVNGLGSKELIHSSSNYVCPYSWAYLCCKLFGEGNPSFRVNYIYFEFENSAGEVAVTDPDPGVGFNYIDSLPVGRDVLRVPLSGTPGIAVKSGYEGDFPAGTGSSLIYTGTTSGNVGVKGTAFSDVNDSRVVRAVLVAAPSVSDYTQDVVLAVETYAGAAQKLKQAGTQLTVTWRHHFLP